MMVKTDISRITFSIDRKTKNRFVSKLAARGLKITDVMQWCVSGIIDDKIDLSPLWLGSGNTLAPFED